MPLDLNREERDFLADLLEKELEDIRSEFHHTQGHEFKESLRTRENLVRDILAKLRA
jgi:hypothetical protein